MTARLAARWLTDALWRPTAGLAVIVAATMLIGAVVIGTEGCSEGTRQGSWGAFSCQTAGIWVFLLPALSGLVAAVYVTAPYQRGEDGPYRARGMSLVRVRAARLISGCAAGSVLLLSASLMAVAASVVVLPWRREALLPVGVGVSRTGPTPDPGLFPALWEANPLAHDLLAAIPVVALAGAAMVAFGGLVGYLTGSAVGAFLGSVLFVLTGQLVSLPGALDKLNPYQFLDIYPEGELWLQYPDNPVVLAVGYWICVLILSSLAIAAVTCRQKRTG